MKNATKLTPETVRRFLEMQRLGNTAVRRAQAENRQLGIPNWYSINGVLVSDQPPRVIAIPQQEGEAISSNAQ
ncbi:MAG: hypothetical protein U0Y68_26240 [Blastocatellia bacterium]